jgi:hypothetical protein
LGVPTGSTAAEPASPPTKLVGRRTAIGIVAAIVGVLAFAAIAIVWTLARREPVEVVSARQVFGELGLPERARVVRASENEEGIDYSLVVDHPVSASDFTTQPGIRRSGEEGGSDGSDRQLVVAFDRTDPNDESGEQHCLVSVSVAKTEDSLTIAPPVDLRIEVQCAQYEGGG